MQAFTEELQEELTEALDFTVNGGYYSPAEIEEFATDYIAEIFEDYDLEMPSEVAIQQLLVELSQQRSGSKEQPNYARLRQVFDQLNQEGIIAIDYAGFDMSEGHEEVGEVFHFMKEHELPRKGYCFYHQQDIERSMASEKLLLAFHSLNGDEEEALAVGVRIVLLLKEAGFEVAWNGTVEERICIEPFGWDKVFDDELVGSERALDQIAKCHGLKRAE